MAREQWAKVDVDMPTDEKLFGRPLLERHLWTCLICLSKKNFIESGDYTIHNLDAAALNTRFNLGSAASVEKGLKYFETCEPRPMIKRRDGSIWLLNIEKRQAKPKDSPEAHRERQARYRNRQRDGYSDGSDPPSPAPSPTAETTRHAPRHTVSPRDAEVEVEVEVEVDQEVDLDPKRVADPVARTHASEVGTENNPGPWPADLLEQLRVALGRQLETNDREWAEWISDTSRRFPLQRRRRAALAFLERPRNGRTFSLGYVAKMIREGAEPSSANGGGPGAATANEYDPMSVEGTEKMLAKMRARKTVPMPEHMRTRK